MAQHTRYYETRTQAVLAWLAMHAVFVWCAVYGRVVCVVDGVSVRRVAPELRKHDRFTGTPYERAMARAKEAGEMTERMAVEITVYLDVPEDVTEEGMDLTAEGVVQTIGVDYDVALNGPPSLVDYVGGTR